jgi:transcriptional regulator with XRE-family HTH domain
MNNHQFTILGDNIRQLRKDRHLSQESFAEVCDLHRTYICDVERGARNMTIGTLMKIAQALGTTVSELTKNVEKTIKSVEKPEVLPHLNAAKSIIVIVALLLSVYSAKAQSLLEGLILESATMSSILQQQTGALVSDGVSDSKSLVGGDRVTVSVKTLTSDTTSPVRLNTVRVQVGKDFAASAEKPFSPSTMLNLQPILSDPPKKLIPQNRSKSAVIGNAWHEKHLSHVPAGSASKTSNEQGGQKVD